MVMKPVYFITPIFSNLFMLLDVGSITSTMPLFHWHVSIFLNTQNLEALASGANKQQNYVLATTWMFLRIITTIAQNSAMGVYFQNSNPLLFAEFSLPQTKIRPKHSEGVVWAQSKGHFRTQHPWKPLHNMLPVWPYLWIFKVLKFFIFGSYLPNWGTTCD